MARKYPISRSKIKIKDKDNQDIDYDPSLEIEVEDAYEAREKNIPPGLPDRYNGQPVTWFNNFVVKEAAKEETAEEKQVPAYKVFLQALPDAPTGPRGVCVYHGGQIHDMTLQDAGPDRKGQVMFTLNSGDPPTGHYP